MSGLNVVSRKDYENRRWKKSTNLFFAQKDSVAHIGVSEFPKAMLATAIGFLADDDNFVPVALQGLAPGQNWFVAMDGKWIGDYLPAVYACYPFRFARTEDQTLVLCIDEASGLITDKWDSDAELFFDEESGPSAAVTQIMNNLNKIELDRARTAAICAILQKYELFEPWPIQVEGTVDPQKIEGIHRISESKLNSISAEALMELRDNNALLLAYGHLFSMQNLHKLGRLGAAQHQARTKYQLNVDSGVLSDTGLISFDNL